MIQTIRREGKGLVISSFEKARDSRARRLLLRGPKARGPTDPPGKIQKCIKGASEARREEGSTKNGERMMPSFWCGARDCR